MKVNILDHLMSLFIEFISNSNGQLWPNNSHSERSTHIKVIFKRDWVIFSVN